MSIATTRLARRRLAAPVLLLAAVAALALNLLVAWVLSALAHRQVEQAEEHLPPPRTVPVRRIAEPVPPPPPVATPVPAPEADAPVASMAARSMAPAVALPALPLVLLTPPTLGEVLVHAPRFAGVIDLPLPRQGAPPVA